MMPFSPDSKKESSEIDLAKDAEDDERKEIILKTMIDYSDKELFLGMSNVPKLTGRIRSWVVDAWRKDNAHNIVKYGLMVCTNNHASNARMKS